MRIIPVTVRMAVKLAAPLCALLAGVCGVQAEAAGACRILVVVGMEDERAIAADEEVEVVVGSANAAVLRERLAGVDADGIDAVYSFGVAGALNPALRPGTLLFSTRVVAQRNDTRQAAIAASWAADASLLASLQAGALEARLGRVREAVFLGSDFEARENPHADGDRLRDASGAATIDNESHIAAEFAHRHRIPFMAVRAVSDSVSRKLPPAALLALDADGRPDGKAIASSLLRQPWQIPALLRTAWDYSRALRALKTFRRDVGFRRSGNCG